MSVSAKYVCDCCGIKSYTRKGSLDKHKVLCEFKHKPAIEKQVELEEAGDVPTHEQLVKIVQELTMKLARMEEKMEGMQKWVDKKKKKLNVIGWLNTNVTPQVGFLEWLNAYLTVTEDHFRELLDNSLYHTVQRVFEHNLEEKDDFIQPIKCFSQKQNTFYIYEKNATGENAWKQMDVNELINMFRTVQSKLIKQLIKWKEDNKQRFHETDKLAEVFNKAVIKLMNMSFTPDASFSRVKNSLYIYLKKDFVNMIEYDLEF